MKMIHSFIITIFVMLMALVAYPQLSAAPVVGSQEESATADRGRHYRDGWRRDGWRSHRYYYYNSSPYYYYSPGYSNYYYYDPYYYNRGSGLYFRFGF